MTLVGRLEWAQHVIGSRIRPRHLLLAAFALASCATTGLAEPPYPPGTKILDRLTTDVQVYFIYKHRWLAIYRNGIVNATSKGSETYTRFKQKLKLIDDIRYVSFQSVATCRHLCIDSTGYLYSSNIFREVDCVLQAKPGTKRMGHSLFRIDNGEKLYLAIDNNGIPRRIALPLGLPIVKHDRKSVQVVPSEPDPHIPRTVCPDLDDSEEIELQSQLAQNNEYI